jgi:hypothetical protein
MTRRSLPPYLRVVGDTVEEPHSRRLPIVQAPAGSARALIAVFTAPYVDAGQRIIERGVSAILQEAIRNGVEGGPWSADSLRDDIKEIVVRKLRETIVEQLAVDGR